MKKPFFPGAILVACCASALGAAWIESPSAVAQPAPKSTASESAATEVGSGAAAQPTQAEPIQAGPVAAPPAADLAARAARHGLSPMFDGSAVPLKWMPPGTGATPVPSEEIFPPQTLTIRFNHLLHVGELGQACTSCHDGAPDSVRASDRLVPVPEDTCDGCHDVDHADRSKVVGGEEEDGKCSFCHLGANAGVDGRVAKMVIPKSYLKMNHKAHLDRNIACSQCHGMVGKLELATRDQLPRMAGCFTCHAMPAASRGKAKGQCTTCHVTEPSGRLKTNFPTGKLKPPTWLHGAEHTPDWIARHKNVAGSNSALCASCHAEHFCADCHDGKLRPRDVHPNDFISMHAVAARQDSPRCVSCHQLTTFCGDCHRRVGISRDSPSANRLAGRRFHLPARIWTTGPRSPMHHSFEAQRNLNACVSCHSERDCASCHATKGIRGGGGVNPHPPGFLSRCGSALRRNPRPCLVCHSDADPIMGLCK